MQQNPNPNQGPNQQSSSITDTLKSLGDGLDKIYNEYIEDVNSLDLQIRQYQANMAGVMGQTQKAISGLREEAAVAYPKIVGLGGEFKDVITIQESIAQNLKINSITMGETVSDLYAGAKAVGLETEKVGEMVGQFKDAGIQTHLIKDAMQTTSDVARGMGVNTKAVFDGVRSNLDKLNYYGFQNGVQGLAKMAAQAASLRIDMTHIFNFANSVFNPEGAVEMVSAFQRLGVAAGDLADPFRLMYLASEDTEELQNQVVKMTEKFTYFDEKSKSFKVFPNAKRDLREIANQTGINYEELVKMSTAGQKLQMLSKDFKVAGIDEETKQFVANVAQYSEGKKGFTVKIGETEKLISELNPQDLEELKKVQEQPQTVEDLARAQLDEDKLMNATLGEIKAALIGAVVGSKAPKDLQEMVRSLTIATGEGARKSATNVRGGIAGVNKAYEQTGESIIDIMKGKGSFEKISEIVKNGGEGIEVGLTRLGKSLETFDYNSVMSKYVSSGNKIYEGAMVAYDGISSYGKKIYGYFTEGDKTKKTGVGEKETSKNMSVDFSPVKVEGNVDINLKNTDGSTTKLTDSQVQQLLDNEQFRRKIQQIITDMGAKGAYPNTPNKAGGGY